MLPIEMFVMSCGVMSMYCLRSEALAVSIYQEVRWADRTPEAKNRTIIRILIRLLTASMKTSNSSASGVSRR